MLSLREKMKGLLVERVANVKGKVMDILLPPRYMGPSGSLERPPRANFCYRCTHGDTHRVPPEDVTYDTSLATATCPTHHTPMTLENPCEVIF
jgi:hypothetical protein